MKSAVSTTVSTLAPTNNAVVPPSEAEIPRIRVGTLARKAHIYNLLHEQCCQNRLDVIKQVLGASLSKWVGVLDDQQITQKRD